ncbi:hypothetical protein [Nannocystis pusilla]|uniref:hypothetical protein n=1 Tax=Nannocystis pusilla TaxID=889268 RepID=UPI003B79FBC1
MRRALLLAILHTGCGPGTLDPILTTGVDPSYPGDATTFDTGGPPETISGASISSASGSGPSPTHDPTNLTSGVPDDCTFVCTATTTDEGSFVTPPDPPAPCDVWAQDCPAGEKCTAAGPRRSKPTASSARRSSPAPIDSASRAGCSPRGTSGPTRVTAASTATTSIPSATRAPASRSVPAPPTPRPVPSARRV